MRFNPFYHLIESRKYRFGRLIRSTYWERYKDCAQIFYGGIFISNLGILDYFFPFARICYNIADSLITNVENGNSKLLIPVALIFYTLAIPLNLIKLAATIALVMAISPIITLAHLLFQPIYKKLASAIETVSIIPVRNNMGIFDLDAMKNNNSTNVIKLNKNDSSQYIIQPIAQRSKFPDIICTHSYWPTESVIYLALYSAQHHLSLEFVDCTPEPINMLTGIIEINNMNWGGIIAMLKTNHFRASTNLEDTTLTTTEDLHEEIEKVMLPRLVKHTFTLGLFKSLRNKSSIKTLAQSEHYDKNITKLIFEFAGIYHLKSKTKLEAIPESVSSNTDRTLNICKSARISLLN